jgi:hypothetical protein
MLLFFTDPSISFLAIHAKLGMYVPELSLVASFLKILNIFLQGYKGLEKLPKKVNQKINNQILYSLIWSIGAIQEESSRAKFSEYIKDIISGKDVVKNFGLECTYPWKINQDIIIML